MQIRVDRLREALELLHPVVPRKTSLDVLGNVLLRNGRAAATDLEVAVALELPEVECECLLPQELVAKLLKYVPGSEVLTIEQKGKSLGFSWDGGQATYEVPKPADYPPLLEVKTGEAQAVDGETLVPALSAMLAYCATAKDRLVLTGVHLTLGETTEVAAGDGFRLAFQTLPIAVSPVDGVEGAVIPASAVTILGHLWRKVPGAPLDGFPARLLKRRLELTLNKTMLQVRFGRVTLTTRLIEGASPNFKQFIQQEAALKVRMLAPDFERAVRRVQDMARENSGIVRLAWSGAALSVSGRSSEKGQVEVSFPVTSEGGDGRVALNVSYLLDYLRGREGLVTMSVISEKAPVLFRHGTSPVVVMMPIFVQW
ncbi:MAG: hypothetical protein HY670_10580 [Chloroflexi bacterium]|nr:hypothetical protein [Chloroflexota bacterium]